METKTKLNIEKFWNEGISYQDYINDAKQRLENPRSDSDLEMKEYLELGLQRMERMYKKFLASEEQLEILKSKNFNGKILIITEPWCGDASQAVPSLFNFFEGRNEVRITYRDQQPSLIDDFMTNNTNSIPIVVLLNENLEVINSWGPRPQPALEFLKQYKADPENYPKEKFYNDLQLYYAKNRGKDTIAELLELL